MRIAAGVLLIVIAAWNLGAGAWYAFIGSVPGREQATAAVEQGERDFRTTSAQARNQVEWGAAKQGEHLARAAKNLLTYGKPFGYLFIILAGFEIAVAVMCFTNNSGAMVLAVGAIAVAAEIADTVMIQFNASNALGILAGLFAVFAGFSILQRPAAMAAEVVPGSGHPALPAKPSPQD